MPAGADVGNGHVQTRLAPLQSLTNGMEVDRVDADRRIDQTAARMDGCPSLGHKIHASVVDAIRWVFDAHVDTKRCVARFDSEAGRGIIDTWIIGKLREDPAIEVTLEVGMTETLGCDRPFVRLHLQENGDDSTASLWGGDNPHARLTLSYKEYDVSIGVRCGSEPRTTGVVYRAGDTFGIRSKNPRDTMLVELAHTLVDDIQAELRRQQPFAGVRRS